MDWDSILKATGTVAKGATKLAGKAVVEGAKALKQSVNDGTLHETLAKARLEQTKREVNNYNYDDEDY